MKKSCFLLAIMGFSLLAAPASVSVLRPPAAPQLQKPIEHEVSVTLKLVQVYVTDKKGKPVRDLTKGDFVVHDNGQLVTITDFETHTLEAPGEPPLPVETAQEAAASRAALSRKFFFFFDFANNTQRGVNKAREAALHFINTEVKPEDEVAVLSYSAISGLAIHEFLTRDLKKVREAVGQLNTTKLSGRAVNIEEQYWRQAAEAPEGIHGDLRGDNVTEFMKNPPIYNWRRQESKSLAQNYLLKLTMLAKSLRAVPGQKQFIFFTTGIVASMIYGAQQGNAWDEPTLNVPNRSKFDPGDTVLRTLNEDMLKEMSSANCSVFTFDTREAAVEPSLFTYDDQTFEERSRDIFFDRGVHQTVDNPLKDDRFTGQYSLRRFSVVTGGKYYSNIGDYRKNLDEVQNLTGTYYVLGYPVSEQWDGKFHELKVSVTRKGCEVRAQAGYFNPKPFSEYSDLEKQLQLFDLALNERPLLLTPLSFGMDALAYAAGEESRLLVLAKIPQEAIKKFSGKSAEIVSLVFDENGNLADLRRTTADFSKYAGMDVFFVAGTALAPGTYRCRLVIRDLDTGTAAIASGQVHVVQKAGIGLTLYSPLVLAPGSNFTYLEAPGAKKAERISWRDIYAYERALYSPAVGEISKSMSKIYFLVPCAMAGIIEPRTQYTGYLLNAETGTQVPATFNFLNKFEKEGCEIIFLELSIADFAPGKYILYLHAEDPEMKRSSHTQVRLVITP